MAGIEANPGKPFLKSNGQASGDVSAIIGFTGAVRGSMALIFTESCLKTIASSLFGEVFDQINEEVKDAAGEVSNMICGDARRRLSEAGINLKGGIPAVVSGRHHSVEHNVPGPSLAIPFETPGGNFIVEVAFL
ncbi:MAG: chemotaxis protein CheX [Syntrophobacteraceae bacterium]